MDDLRKKIVPMFRIAVLGPKGVGKTSVINSFVNNSFEPLYEETENDIRKYRRVYDINRNPLDPQYILFQIEDMQKNKYKYVLSFPTNHEDLESGDDFVKSQIYYGLLENKQIRSDSKPNTNIMQMEKQIYGFVFVYDVNDDKTFQQAAEVIKYLSGYSESKRKFSGFISKKILIGNKIGLYQLIKILDIYHKEEGPFDKKMVKTFLETNSMQKFLVSAKTSYNISMAFEELGKLILNDIKMEMVEREWFGERQNAIKDIDDRVRASGNKKQEDDKSNSIKQGFLGCGGGKATLDDDSEEEDGYDEEDNEFAQVPYYSQSMDDQNDGCLLF